MNNIRLDLFKLHDENDKGRGRIKVIVNKELKLAIDELIKEIKSHKKLKIKEFSRNMGFSRTLFYAHSKRRRFYISALKELIKLWSKLLKKSEIETNQKEIEIQYKIKKLCCGSGNNFISITCPNLLTEDLCKIAGAIVADGNLYIGRDKKNKKIRKWAVKIADHYRDNLEIFSDWINKEFGLQLVPKMHKTGDYWFIEFSNKIIFYYLSKIFDIPVGKKSGIVKLPNMIKKSPLNYKQAFLKALFLFDGGIGFYRCEIKFGSKSMFLIKDVVNILEESGIKLDYISKKPNPSNGLFQLAIWNKDKIEKFNGLFMEPKTTKSKQLDLHINGLRYRGKNLNDIMDKLSLIYPRARKSSMTFKDIIELFNKSKFLTKKDIQKSMNRHERNISAILNTLERWDILISQKQGIYKVWSINSKLKSKGGV